MYPIPNRRMLIGSSAHQQWWHSYGSGFVGRIGSQREDPPVEIGVTLQSETVGQVTRS